MASPRYEITVWNNATGDVVKYARGATEAELADIEEYYGDEPGHEVVIDNEWEEEDDED